MTGKIPRAVDVAAEGRERERERGRHGWCIRNGRQAGRQAKVQLSMSVLLPSFTWALGPRFHLVP